MPQQVTFWRRVGRLLRGNLSGNGETGPSLGTGVLEPADPRPVAGGRTADPDGALGAQQQRRSPATPCGRPRPPWWKPAARRAQAQAAALSRRPSWPTAPAGAFPPPGTNAAPALATALDRLGGVLEQIADNQRAQSESLRTITEHTDSAARHAASVVSTLARVPESLHAQAEALRGVARQLELGQTSDTQLLPIDAAVRPRRGHARRLPAPPRSRPLRRPRRCATTAAGSAVHRRPGAKPALPGRRDYHECRRHRRDRRCGGGASCRGR